MSELDRKRKFAQAAESFRRATREFHEAVGNSKLSLNRHVAQSALAKGPRVFLGYIALVRALKSYPEFLAERSAVVIVLVPHTWLLDDMENLAEICFENGNTTPPGFNAFTHPVTRNKKRQWDFNPSAQMAYSKVVCFAKRGAELHPEVEAAADVVLNLVPANDRDLRALARLLQTGDTSSEDNEFLRQQPCTFLDAIFRKGRSAKLAIQRSRAISSRAAGSSKALPIDTFGEAGEWAKRLRNDIEAWREGKLQWQDIDKGVLVYGPPGTGKTAFAASLANYLEVPLVAASLARWQSSGHLGDLLKAMFSDFAQARSVMPSVLLIDEMDSIGDRRAFSGDNAEYMTEVVTALLEALDGTIGRDGVIVVGASNYPDKIDDAILRPGRLEKHLELSRPNQSAREKIVRFYLPDVERDILRIATTRLQGSTGADIEYFARRVKQRARIAGRSITSDDVLDELPPEVLLSENDIWRVSIHEAGHAVLARLFRIGEIECVEIAARSDRSDTRLEDVHGRVVITEPTRKLNSESVMRNRIAMTLGGLIAEQLLIGDKSTVSGGKTTSDLATATEEAIKMIGLFGMGRSLHVYPEKVMSVADATIFERFPDLKHEVQFLLNTEYQRAKKALQDHEKVVVAIAEALKDEGCLSGRRLEKLLSPVDVNPSVPVGPSTRREIRSAI